MWLGTNKPARHLFGRLSHPLVRVGGKKSASQSHSSPLIVSALGWSLPLISCALQGNSTFLCARILCILTSTLHRSKDTFSVYSEKGLFCEDQIITLYEHHWSPSYITEGKHFSQQQAQLRLEGREMCMGSMCAGKLRLLRCNISGLEVAGGTVMYWERDICGSAAMTPNVWHSLQWKGCQNYLSKNLVQSLHTAIMPERW